MVTGASTADLAVILIDARKGVLTQTRRHSFLVSLLGIRHVVLAINKLDLVDYSQEVFDSIEADYRAFAAEIGLDDIVCIPLSALRGDNITEPSRQHALVRRARPSSGTSRRSRSTTSCTPVPFRMPVQWVNRPNLDFRGFSGEIVGGTVRPGDRVRVLPSGRESHGRRASSPPTATSPRPSPASRSPSPSPTRSTSRRGDVHRRRRPHRRAWPTSSRPTWSGWPRTSMLPGRPYLLKIGARTVTRHRRPAQVQGQRQHPRAHRGQDARAQRDRGLQRQPRPARSRSTPTTRTATWAGSSSSTGSPTPPSPPACCTSRCAGPTTCTGRRSRSTRRPGPQLNGQRPAVVWFTGLSGAGKSTIANIVEQKLHELGSPHLPARRRQRPPRPQPGPRLHRRRPGREHPPGRRGRQA